MKKIKIALSLILAIALTSIMVLPAFAVCNEDCKKTPVIQVRGIGETLYDENGNEIFSTDNIVNGILPVMPQLADFLLTQNTASFVDAAEVAVKTIFGPVMYDKNGVREGEVTVNCTSDPVEKYMDFTANDLSEEEKLAKALYEELGDNHVFFFTYDWTADPYIVVDQLETFIDDVKDKTGHDKVSINAESMGGAIVNLYIAENGHGSIENLVMANSAFNGLEMIGQLFMGNTQIDGQALAYLISQEIRGNAEYQSLLAYLPIFEQLALMANDIMIAEKAAIYERILLPVFGYLPSFWALVPSYSFDAAKDYMFGENTGTFVETRANVGEDLLGIVNDIKRDVDGTTERVDLMINGYKILNFWVVEPINNYACVSNYNRFIAPVTPSSQWNSDGVIEVYNTSGWAIAADMGMTLSEEYLEENSNHVISPDKVIDASTCQAPMNTWFIKNLGHVQYGLDDGTADFYVWLLTAKDKYDINANAEYPQFMYYDTSIPELMTWEEKEANDADGGINLPTIGLPGLPEIDLDGLAGALEQIIGGLGELDLSVLTDLLGTLGGVVGSLGDMLGGLLGGDTGTTTPEPEEPSVDNGDTSTDAPVDTPTDTPTETPSTPSAPSTNNSNSGSSTVVNNQINPYSGTAVFSSGADTWIILFVIAAVVAGILIIKL